MSNFLKHLVLYIADTKLMFWLLNFCVNAKKISEYHALLKHKTYYCTTVRLIRLTRYENCLLGSPQGFARDENKKSNWKHCVRFASSGNQTGSA